MVWLDALLTNVDRTIKNTNMLMWHKELWLIDHGAALYFSSFMGKLAETGCQSFLRIKTMYFCLMPASWKKRITGSNKY